MLRLIVLFVCILCSNIDGLANEGVPLDDDSIRQGAMDFTSQIRESVTKQLGRQPSRLEELAIEIAGNIATRVPLEFSVEHDLLGVINKDVLTAIKSRKGDEWKILHDSRPKVILNLLYGKGTESAFRNASKFFSGSHAGSVDGSFTYAPMMPHDCDFSLSSMKVSDVQGIVVCCTVSCSVVSIVDNKRKSITVCLCYAARRDGSSQPIGWKMVSSIVAE